MEEIVLGSIYKIIDNRSDEIVYVGQHWYNTKSSINSFGKGANDRYMGGGKNLKITYKIEGIENFRKELIVYDIFEQNDMDKLEIFWISQYKPKYNISSGGYSGWLGMSHTEESKQKMSKSRKGKKNRIYGPLSEEHKNKISISRKGKKVHTEEFKEKMREKWKNNKLNVGREPWNKGLNKDSDERVKNYGESISKTKEKNQKINNIYENTI